MTAYEAVKRTQLWSNIDFKQEIPAKPKKDPKSTAKHNPCPEHSSNPQDLAF